MLGVRLAVITDQGQVPRFGLEALNSVTSCDEITVLSCTNSRRKRPPRQQAAHHALSRVIMRNPMTASVPVTTSTKRIARTITFESQHEGARQSFPATVLTDLSTAGFDVVVKLGMGPLTIPQEPKLPPIISYHYSGRERHPGVPEGLWEVAHGESTMGQMVRVLTNNVDDATCAAFAETRVYAHSLRATLIEAYRHSPFLLQEAVENVCCGGSLPTTIPRENCSLPSNTAVVSLVFMMAFSLLKRLCYGAFVEKRWNVSLANCSPDRVEAVITGRPFPSPRDWRTLPVTRSQLFFADPFFSEGLGGVVVEAVNRRTGLGEILLVSDDGQRRLSNNSGAHYSYPCTINVRGSEFILPEVASWSSPIIYGLEDKRMVEQKKLSIAGSTPVVDPTLVEHEGRFYLFGNIPSVGNGALFLWSSSSIDGHFDLHPASPVRISPQGSRMGGGLLKLDKRLIRFGQSSISGYGDGLLAFEVHFLTPDRYSEVLLGEIRLGRQRGPHTLNFYRDQLVFDWYRNRVSVLAGVRRLRSLHQRRRRRATTTRPRIGVSDQHAAVDMSPVPACDVGKDG